MSRCQSPVALAHSTHLSPAGPEGQLVNCVAHLFALWGTRLFYPVLQRVLQVFPPPESLSDYSSPSQLPGLPSQVLSSCTSRHSLL